ncbi:MAG TPA: hypothetical protein VLY04_14460 [Bryobacteraceae bacterium]|nr:hypothetical protein [Bryobacteraceae bacterium]
MSVRSPGGPELSDGVITLRPLREENAGEHLRGEDEEMATWLSGGHSSLANVHAYIWECRKTGATSDHAARLAFLIALRGA